jgi:hypothetical protein
MILINYDHVLLYFSYTALYICNACQYKLFTRKGYMQEYILIRMVRYTQIKQAYITVFFEVFTNYE